ncbi:MAG: superoxide dismutase [Planctomycetota bacterium]
MAHTLPELPYEYSALEPHIDARTMEIHHSKHHQAYVNNLNNAEEELRSAVQSGDVHAVVRLTAAVNFNGGGHANHTLFWSVMGPGCGGEPDGEVRSAIDDAFGDFGAFQKHFSGATAAIQGSGWGWLCWSPTTRSLVHHCTQNQDNPVKVGLVPILGLDVWEHAYYLNYQNRRPDYIKAWWNLVSWAEVARRFEKARG